MTRVPFCFWHSAAYKKTGTQALYVRRVGVGKGKGKKINKTAGWLILFLLISENNKTTFFFCNHCCPRILVASLINRPLIYIDVQYYQSRNLSLLDFISPERRHACRNPDVAWTFFCFTGENEMPCFFFFLPCFKAYPDVWLVW